MTVLEATIQTLKNLGGKASLKDIYEEYENVVQHKITKKSASRDKKMYRNTFVRFRSI